MEITELEHDNLKIIPIDDGVIVSEDELEITITQKKHRYRGPNIPIKIEISKGWILKKVKNTNEYHLIDKSEEEEEKYIKERPTK